MRVLHLTTHTNVGGITTYIKRLVRPLQSLGVKSYLFSSGGECDSSFQNEGVILSDKLFKTKSAIHPKLWASLPDLLRFLKTNQIDVMHAHTRITQILATVASLLTGIPVVSTCHGFFKLHLGRKLFPCWGKKVIAISGMVQDHLLNDFKLASQSVRLILNAVDIKDLETQYAKKNSGELKLSYGFGPKDPVVGIIARLVSDKGHEYLLKSVPCLKKSFPNLKVLIVGEGKYRSTLDRLVGELQLQQDVHFCGNVFDITEPLAAMDIFTLPATWREGFGLSLVEAMACRKPVIVSNIWALNELIENRLTGLVIPPKQPEALAEAITLLLQNPAMTSSLQNQAYRLVTSKFSIERMAREVHEVYVELIQGKS